MEVNFNNLRKQTAESFSLLTDILNSCYIPGKGIHVASFEIKETMHELKECISSLCACYNDEPERIESIADQIEISTFLPDEIK